MRVTCRCGEKAVITKTNRISFDAVDLYCSCGGCGHRFVWAAGFKHSLAGSTGKKREVINSLIGELTKEEMRDLAQSILKVCA